MLSGYFSPLAGSMGNISPAAIIPLQPKQNTCIQLNDIIIFQTENLLS